MYNQNKNSFIYLSLSVLVLMFILLFISIDSSEFFENKDPLISTSVLASAAGGNVHFAAADSTTIKPPAELGNIREEVILLTENSDIPSIAVGVALNGEIIWQEAFGWADLENNIPATPHTKYSVASVTKPITATGILMLADRGFIDLDEPANRYLNDTRIRGFAGDADLATVRRVLNHTSGLPLHYHFFYDDYVAKPPPMEESIRRYGILTHQPGERYLYSNIGYGVLDHIISSVSGKSYSSFLRDEIFEPIGMENTSVGITSPKPEQYAVRYGHDLERLPFYDFDHRGASAVFSSVHDLLRFGKFILGNISDVPVEMLSDSLRAEMMFKSTHTGMHQFSGYGLGWSITEHKNGLKEVWHSGGMAGVRTVLKLVPETGLVVVVLHNSNNSRPLEIADKMIQLFHEDRYEYNRPVMSRQNEFDMESIIGVWSGEITTYSGVRHLQMVVEQNGVIEIEMEGNKPVPLVRPYVDEFGFLRGIFLGELGTYDTSHKIYALYLNARPAGSNFYGSVTAVSIGGTREGFALSSYIELERSKVNNEETDAQRN